MAKTKVNEDVFNKVKKLCNHGVTPRDCEQYVNLSRETIRRIGNADSFEDYRAIQDRYYASSAKNRNSEIEECEQETVTECALNDGETLNEILRVLKVIAIALGVEV